MTDWPPFLHRYVSLRDDERKRWARDFIVARQVYFTRPIDFNDPFECAFTLNIDAPQSHRLNRLTRYLQRMKGIDRHSAKELAKADLKKGWYFSPEHQAHAHKEMTDAIRTQSGMICLSAKDNDSLMWAHYADSHRGICITLDMAIEKWIGFPAAGPEPVVYQDDLPALDWFTATPEKLGRTTAYTKASQWAYENEWRMFHPSLGGKTHAIPKAIDAITLGCRVPQRDVDLVREWIRESGQHIRLRRAVPSRASYDVTVVDV